MAKILVTGGAGYVGSHCARELVRAGHEVTTFDNLSQGHADAASGELVVGDLRDRQAVDAVLSRGFDCVLHFAALMAVGESVDHPVDYFDVNVGGTLNLLIAMRQHGCDKLVFSSTCAVYGEPAHVPITETTPHAPISPYGETKATVEAILANARRVGEVQSVCLRYFNACGASEDGHLGEAHFPESHVIPVAFERLIHGKPFAVFGTDYPTPDGSCVRDYVHVLDLADAHLRAVEHLLAGGQGGAWNLGSGRGYSVLELIAAVERVTGRQFSDIKREPRRPGDPPELVAAPAKVAADLGWRTTRDLDVILADAWRWFQAPRFGPGTTSRER